MSLIFSDSLSIISLSIGLFEYIKGHVQAAGVSYLGVNEQAILNYLANMTLCEPQETVLLSTTVKSLSDDLFAFTDAIRTYCTCDIKLPRIHFEPFKPDNVAIYDKVIRIEKDGLKFILFTPSNDQKEILNKKIKYYKNPLDRQGSLNF